MSNTLRYGPRQVQGAPGDRVPPRLGPALKPLSGAGRVPARYDIKQLAPTDVDDLGGPDLASPTTGPALQGLVQSERFDVGEPCRVIDESSPVGDHGVHHRVPTGAELGRPDRSNVAGELRSPEHTR